MLKRLVMNMSEDHFVLLQKLKEKYKAMSYSEVIRRLLADAEDRDLDNYREIEKRKIEAKSAQKSESPEERILRQEEEALLRKDMKNKAAENRGEKICLSMIGGKVTPDGYCEFPVWHERVGSVVEKRTRRVPTESMVSDIPQHLSFITAKPEAARKRVEEAMLLPENAGNKDLAI